MGGTQSSESATASPPPLTTRIPLADLVANPEAHRAKIIDCMRENGLITFRLDEETQVRVLLCSECGCSASLSVRFNLVFSAGTCVCLYVCERVCNKYNVTLTCGLMLAEMPEGVPRHRSAVLLVAGGGEEQTLRNGTCTVVVHAHTTNMLNKHTHTSSVCPIIFRSTCHNTHTHTHNTHTHTLCSLSSFSLSLPLLASSL